MATGPTFIWPNVSSSQQHLPTPYAGASGEVHASSSGDDAALRTLRSASARVAGARHHAVYDEPVIAHPGPPNDPPSNNAMRQLFTQTEQHDTFGQAKQEVGNVRSRAVSHSGGDGGSTVVRTRYVPLEESGSEDEDDDMDAELMRKYGLKC